MAKKGELHIRNKHNGQYDFPLLMENYPPLKRFVSLNPLGIQTINFFNPQAVKALNKALLVTYYGIRYWDIPKQYLCPPIPGRADYIHYIADLIQPNGTTPDLPAGDANGQKSKCRCLDIGVGANCIYPIIICNPPFHSSREEAEDGTLRKLSSLKGTKINKVQLNFGGSANELWCEGGEVRFLLNMISESQKYQKNCGWFTSLVSKEKNLEKLYTKLKSVNVSEYKVIRMQQGTKSSRILAWRFATNS